jgi:hypothetical protein
VKINSPKNSLQKRRKTRLAEEKGGKQPCTGTLKTFEQNQNQSMPVKKAKVLLQQMDVNQFRKGGGSLIGRDKAKGTSGSVIQVRKEGDAPSGWAEGSSGTESEEKQSFSRDQNDVEDFPDSEAAEEAKVEGGFHDQTDAEWIVIGALQKPPPRPLCTMGLWAVTPRSGGWPPIERFKLNLSIN